MKTASRSSTIALAALGLAAATAAAPVAQAAQQPAYQAAPQPAYQPANQPAYQPGTAAAHDDARSHGHPSRAGIQPYHLAAADRAELLRIARDSWRLYEAGLDPKTHLPLDNLTYAGGATTPTSYGRYTSAANVGVYLWAVVSAMDLKIISRAEAEHRVTQTLRTVAGMDRYHGFLHQWYDTTTGKTIRNPGQPFCDDTDRAAQNNCTFISQVDNGWYVSGLVVVRQAMPRLTGQVNKLMKPVDFSIFYDDRPQTACNVNSTIPGAPPTGQMFGGVYVGFDPKTTNMYHNGAIYSDPRISAYLGMGMRQMPGDVWWRTWRTMPPQAPGCENTDPVFDWQGQWPPGGRWAKVVDPIGGKTFNVWEGHYTDPMSGAKYLPSWNSGMFESLMAGEIVPETSWGTKNFGTANQRTVALQKAYATKVLGYPVWGMSPSSTADDTGGYGIYGAWGRQLPVGKRLANCGQDWCGVAEDVVTPHASFLALDAAPADAMANIRALRSHYPQVYGVNGFFDAVNPTTGAVGHRYLVLDQSMIMAAIDNAVNNRAIQRYFAADRVSWAARAVLRVEDLRLG